MSFGHQHAALISEYQSLMDEEHALWRVIREQLVRLEDGSSSDAPADADFARWSEVRRRRALLDQALEAMVQPMRSQWASLVGDLT